MSALPEGVTIREGGYYRRRDGTVVGPARLECGDSETDYPWVVGRNLKSARSYRTTYPDNGRWSIDGEDEWDIVAEVQADGSPLAAPSTADTVLPIDSQARKDTPIFSGVARYFPLALAEVARLSKAGNDKHNPGEPLHWSRGKSNDHADCAMRHLIESGTRDPDDGHLHTTKLAWRALAMLQIELENLSKGGAVSS